MGARADLTGRVALVTGAGSGFGRAMSVAFCEAGAQVHGVGRRSQALQETAALAGQAFHPIAWDITCVDRARELVGKVLSAAGRLDVLVNNAAVLLDDEVPLSKLSQGAWERTMTTNVTAGFALTQAAFEPMRKACYGRVVFVTSGLGFRPMLEYGSYCVSKAAVNMMVRIFAIEGRKDNVLVNAIDPGVARTEMNRSATEPPESVNAVALRLATLADRGTSGACFNKALKQLEW